MRIVTLLAAFSLCLGVAPMVANAVGFTDPETTAHSGGCRKSSPPGQCCHAGSQPLHCH